jgi:hypothetical protein
MPTFNSFLGRVEGEMYTNNPPTTASNHNNHHRIVSTYRTLSDGTSNTRTAPELRSLRQHEHHPHPIHQISFDPSLPPDDESNENGNSFRSWSTLLISFSIYMSECILMLQAS